MAKLNVKKTPVTTHNDGKGYKRASKTTLFLTATTSFAGEDKHYEKASESDQKAIQLTKELAIADWKWLSQFLPWLRQSANIRTMSIMLAAEAVHARLAAKQYGENRQLISAVLQRPDEPKELIAYWINTYGRSIPQPVKRGVADAVERMLNERQALRYDKDSDPVRLGDVIELVHPKGKYVEQGKLFEYLITDRHNREDYDTPAVLTAIKTRDALNKLSPDERHEFARKAKKGETVASAMWKEALAGQWEWGRSWLGTK